MTRRLYREDPECMDFKARVQAVESAGDRWKIILDRTAFFPEGGGQPGDRGTLDGVPVEDVREENDRVVHLLGAPLPVGRTVQGRVNAEHRRDFMQQHTGQHIISAAYWREGGLVTRSVHMGADTTTIDLEAPELDPGLLDRVVKRVNAVIAADLPLDAVETTPEELPRFRLRKPPPVAGPVRLVRIADFDCVGCCGLHLAATGPVRLAVCTGWERIRGMIRTYWKIGDRAVADLLRRVTVMNTLRELLATRDEDLADAVRRRLQENADLHGRMGWAERRLGEYLSRDLLASGAERVTRILDREPPESEKTAVKALLAAKTCDFALVNTHPDRLTWTLGLPRGGTLDFREMKQRYLDPLGARGGGRAPLWQGSAAADVPAPLLLAALEQILKSVSTVA